MFGDGPLGREICGDEAGIRALPEATIRDFWRTTYRPANTVVAVAGDLAHDEAVELAAAAFGTGNGVVPGFAPGAGAAGRRARAARQARHRPRPSSSSACRRCGATIPDAWALALLNAVLGDGMSSRLFLSVREERGLAYDISSGLVDYADAGALEISAGVDPARVACGARGHPRRAGPAARRAGPAPTSSTRPSATCPAGSSCGWTRPATSPRGSAGRRRSTTAS